MAEEPIRHEQIIEEDVFKPASQGADELLLKLNGLIAGFKQLLIVTGKKLPIADPKTISEYEKQLDLLKQIDAADKGLTTTKKLQIQVQEKVNKASRDFRAELKGQESAYAALNNQYAIAAKRAKDIGASQGTNSKAFKEAAKDAKALSDQLKGIDHSLGQDNRNVGNYFEGVKEALTGLPGAFGRAVEGAKALGKEFLSLLANPIVLLIAAVTYAIYGLFKAFTSTVEGGLKFKEILEEVSAVMDVIKQRAGLFATAIGDIFTLNWSKAAGEFKEAITGIGDALSKAKKAGQEYADALHEIEEAEIHYVSSSAERKRKIAELEFISHDLTKPIAERRAALKEALDLAKEDADQSTKIAQDKYEAIAERESKTLGIRKETLTAFLQLDGEAAKKELQTNKQLASAVNLLGVDRLKALSDAFAAQSKAQEDFFNENKRNESRLSKFEQDAVDDRKKALEADLLNLQTNMGERKRLTEEDYKQRLSILERQKKLELSDRSLSYNDRLLITAKYNKEESDLAIQLKDDLLSIQHDLEDAQVAAIKGSYDKQIAQERINAERKLEAIKGYSLQEMEERRQIQNNLDDAIAHLSVLKELDAEKQKTQIRLLQAEKGSKEELDAKIAAFEADKKIETENANATIKNQEELNAALAYINERYRKQEEDATKAYNRRINEDQKKAYADAKVLELKRLGASDSKILKAEKDAAAKNRDVLLKEEGLTAGQRELIWQQYYTDIANLEKQANQKRIEEAQIVEKAIFKATQDRIEKEKALNATKISELDRQIDQQFELLKAGQANTYDFLQRERAKALEEKAALEKKAQKEKEKEQLVEIYFEFVKQYADEPNSVLKALEKTAEAYGGKAIAEAIAGSFATGVEDFKGKGTGMSDSNLIRFSKGESVLTAKGTAETKGLATAINKKGKDGVMQWVYNYITNQGVAPSVAKEKAQTFYEFYSSEPVNNYITNNYATESFTNRTVNSVKNFINKAFDYSSTTADHKKISYDNSVSSRGDSMVDNSQVENVNNETLNATDSNTFNDSAIDNSTSEVNELTNNVKTDIDKSFTDNSTDNRSNVSNKTVTNKKDYVFNSSDEMNSVLNDARTYLDTDARQQISNDNRRSENQTFVTDNNRIDNNDYTSTSTAENYLSHYYSYPEDDKQAASKAVVQTLADSGLKVESFLVGKENIGTTNNPLDNNGGRLIVAHDNESVVTGQATKETPGLVTDVNKKGRDGVFSWAIKQPEAKWLMPKLDMPIPKIVVTDKSPKQETSEAMLSVLTHKFDELQKTIKNKKELTVSRNVLGELVIDETKSGNRTQTVQKKPITSARRKPHG